MQNVSNTAYSIRLLYKLLSIYQGSDVFRHCQTFKMEYFGKKVMYKCRRGTRKFSCHRNFHGTREVCQKHTKKVVSVAEYATISLDIPKYPWKCLNKFFRLCQGFEYGWLFYMFESLGFRIWHSCICNGSADFWICLNMDHMSQYPLMSPNMSHNCWILFNTLEHAWKHLNKLFWLCQGSQ